MRVRWTQIALFALLQVQAAHSAAQERKQTSPDAKNKPPSEYVNTLRGSDSSASFSRGNTFPAVALPFGFNLWTPVTQPDAASWLYKYKDQSIHGFSASHEATPQLGDYASFQILPSVGALKWRADRAQPFKHAREAAKPHYYKVELGSGIRVEITPTAHAALLRVTFPERGTRNLLFDANDSASGTLQADAAQSSISGALSFRGPRLYVFAKLDAGVQTVFDPPDGGPNVALTLRAGGARTVNIRVGTSYVSAEQARANVESELGERGFDEVRAEAGALWDSYLGRIEIEGASDNQKTTFYSNLYRALLYPTSMTEQAGGNESHFSPFSRDVRPGPLFTNNGFWSTYRSAWPLFMLLLPQAAGHMLDGYVNASREGGWVPRWSSPGYRDALVGTHSDAIFADAYLKGVRNFDVEAAYASMLKNAFVLSNRVSLGRGGQERGLFHNYIPEEDKLESASWHLENCVNDFSISRLAQALGDDSNAEYLRWRALNYATLFSPSLGFFRGRRADGSPRTPDSEFHPEAWGFEFTRGNAWHYIAAANHDPGGMASLYGGANGFATKLDALLDAAPDDVAGSHQDTTHEMREAQAGGMGQYAHSAANMHHVLYMYDYVGQPWQTQKYVRKVLSDSAPFYGPGLTGGGYLGDDDTGELSAWYIFSALGFYPASPGHDSYAIGSPLFERATIKLENGKTFQVHAHDNLPNNVYIQRATLDGQPLEVPYIAHSQIADGGVLELYMADKQSTWGSSALAQPELAGAERLREGVMTDCAQRGVASASSENPDYNELSQHAFDNDSRSKWLAQASSAWLKYQLLSECAIRFYTLTSANDEPARDPKDWVLEGSNDGANWSTLDQRQNENFVYRYQTRVFQLENDVAFSQYRLTIRANHGGPQTQLSELELLSVRDSSDIAAQPRAANSDHDADLSVWSRVADHLGCAVVAGRLGRGAPSSLQLAAFVILVGTLFRRRRFTGRAASKPVRSCGDCRLPTRGGIVPARVARSACRNNRGAWHRQAPAGPAPAPGNVARAASSRR